LAMKYPSECPIYERSGRNLTPLAKPRQRSRAFRLRLFSHMALAPDATT
jgi:hypothetical protein